MPPVWPLSYVCLSQVYEPSTGVRYTIEQPEPVMAAWSSHNCLFETDVLRFEYSSPVTPRCTIDFNMRTRERKLLKQTEVRHQSSKQTGPSWLKAPARWPAGWLAG